MRVGLGFGGFFLLGLDIVRIVCSMTKNEDLLLLRPPSPGPHLHRPS